MNNYLMNEELASLKEKEYLAQAREERRVFSFIPKKEESKRRNGYYIRLALERIGL